MTTLSMLQENMSALLEQRFIVSQMSEDKRIKHTKRLDAWISIVSAKIDQEVRNESGNHQEVITSDILAN